MYTFIEALFTIKRVELIRKKEFVTAALNPDEETFVVYIASITSSHLIYLFFRAKIALFKADEISTAILSEYANFADVFLRT